MPRTMGWKCCECMWCDGIESQDTFSMDLLKRGSCITRVKLTPSPPPPLNNIFTNVYNSLPVNSLIEDQVYTFQVFSLSNTDYQAGSNEFELQVPPYRRMRAIAIGATTGLLILLAASAVFIYTKKRCFNPYEAENNEKS